MNSEREERGRRDRNGRAQNGTGWKTPELKQLPQGMAVTSRGVVPEPHRKLLAYVCFQWQRPKRGP